MAETFLELWQRFLGWTVIYAECVVATDENHDLFMQMKKKEHENTRKFSFWQKKKKKEDITTVMITV